MDLVLGALSAIWHTAYYAIVGFGLLCFGLAIIILIRRQFGIGMISNKALADRLQIRLCEDQRAGDPRAEDLRRIATWAEAGNWYPIAARLREWDRDRCRFATGHRVTPMAVRAALTGLRKALNVRYETGIALSRQTLEDRVEEYEQLLDTAPDDPMIALVVAEAHMMYGWEVMFPGGSNAMSEEGWNLARPHYRRAAQLLDPLDARRLDSPAIARAQYYLSLGSEDGAARANAAAALWEALDPGDTELFIDHGYHLSPAWFGDYETLDREAHGAAERRTSEFGKGAYALMFIRPMHCDGAAWKIFDIDLLTESALDLARTSGSQWWVNYVASWLWDNSQKGQFDNRPKFQAAFAALCREDLCELVPALWRDSTNVVLRHISECFPEELARGASLRFTPAGVRVLEAQPG